MRRIASECPQCGRIELGIGDVTLVVNQRECRAWYLFDCTGCARQVVKVAPAPVVWALCWVHVAQWIVPAEVLERRQLGEEPPPISADDLLDVMLWLRTCHDPGRLLTEVTPIDGSAEPLASARLTPFGGAAHDRRRPPDGQR